MVGTGERERQIYSMSLGSGPCIIITCLLFYLYFVLCRWGPAFSLHNNVHVYDCRLLTSRGHETVIEQGTSCIDTSDISPNTHSVSCLQGEPKGMILTQVSFVHALTTFNCF